MKRQDFYYELPEELIAQDPLKDRSSSRLLVLDKESGAVSHHVFKEITDYLHEGDCLVINDTKVIPARLIGSKVGSSETHCDPIKISSPYLLRQQTTANHSFLFYQSRFPIIHQTKSKFNLCDI